MIIRKGVIFTPIADESLGVRSMAAFLVTPDVKIFFDPALSLAPRRYGLPPHPVELETAARLREKILDKVDEADIVTISHYHRDHYTPPYKSLYEQTEERTFLGIYGEKILLAKSYESNINFNQKKRAYVLFKKIEEAKINTRTVFLDNDEVSINNTRVKGIIFPHGAENSKLGWVLGFLVYYEEELLLAFLPDVQGPVSQKTVKTILSLKPKVVVLGGPPTYLAGKKVKREDIAKGLENLASIIKELRESRVVISHHILRDKEWETTLSMHGIQRNQVYLYSDLLGKKFTGLEAYRDVLYEVEKPDDDYLKQFSR